MSALNSLIEKALDRVVDKIGPARVNGTPDQISFIDTYRSTLKKGLELSLFDNGIIKAVFEEHQRELMKELRDSRVTIERLKHELSQTRKPKVLITV